MKYLFENFLDDPRTYTLNETYWRKLVRMALPKDSIEQTDIYTSHFANGKKMRDGNPIFSAKLKGGNTIRVIQEEAGTDSPEITGWIEEKENDRQELIIHLELSDTTRDLVKNLLKNLELLDFSTETITNHLFPGGTPSYAMAA